MLTGGARPQCPVRPAHTPAVYFRERHFAFGNLCAGKRAALPRRGVCHEPSLLGLTLRGGGQSGADRWSPLLSTFLSLVTVPSLSLKSRENRVLSVPECGRWEGTPSPAQGAPPDLATSIVRFLSSKKTHLSSVPTACPAEATNSQPEKLYGSRGAERTWV